MSASSLIGYSITSIAFNAKAKISASAKEELKKTYKKGFFFYQQYQYGRQHLTGKHTKFGNKVEEIKLSHHNNKNKKNMMKKRSLSINTMTHTKKEKKQLLEDDCLEVEALPLLLLSHNNETKEEQVDEDEALLRRIAKGSV